jgi:hypothetical protein
VVVLKSTTKKKKKKSIPDKLSKELLILRESLGLRHPSLIHHKSSILITIRKNGNFLPHGLEHLRINIGVYRS